VSREQHGGQPTYWPCGVRRIGGVTRRWAFVRNLRTGLCDGKGKGTSGGPTRPKVPKRQPGAHCFVVVRKRGNSRGAKGAGHPRRVGVNGQRTNSTLDRLSGSFTMERRNEAKRSSVKLRSIADGFSWVRAFLGSVLTLTKKFCARIAQERRLRLRSTGSIPLFSHVALRSATGKRRVPRPACTFRRGRAPFYNAC
jgi:hypothetical protein